MAAALKPDAGLHVRLPKRLASRIRSEADGRGVRPFVLLGHAIQRVLDDDLLDTLLSDLAPETVTPTQLALLPGLTHIQGALLLVMARYTDEYGICLASTDALGTAVPCGQSTVCRAVHALLDRDLIALAASPSGATNTRPYQLTEAGWHLANLLGDFKGRDR